ncbi:alpha/beta fold hydrolase [Pseudomonas indica]|uniref:Pimeloyl-ACP methyl ester carboxylesterase n=1 Tax=Pseudomonas indica TaxID=137658 RepID=A0A1G9GTV9_9PSED|nr:alpha/beta hydrolase [Pseudomonas indica]SDL03975.1 Pimeloyl-ACP methyl ester carboxylesterase [Pseudomonas indica]
MLKSIEAGVLDIAYEEIGPADGWPVLLMHGFPYDIHAYAEVAPALADRGARVIVPYLRGYGPTRFLRADTPRLGQQAAMGQDILALLDVLAIDSALLVGYDWGGRGACIVAALWPQRVRGLVSIGGYLIQDIARAMEPDEPEYELPYWYQYYFHNERGRAGLERNRRALCALLWRLWSPTWDFDEATFARSAAAFDNPDFVEVVIHSYRHRFGLAAGDPALEDIERRLAAQPPISVPALSVDGADDGVILRSTAAHARHFSGWHRHAVVAGAGHNLPQEKPAELVELILELHDQTR